MSFGEEVLLFFSLDLTKNAMFLEACTFAPIKNFDIESVEK